MYNAVNTRRTTAQLPGSQFAALLAAIRDSEHRLDRKLADFKTDVQQAQDEAATKAVNRVRNDKPYHYKKEGRRGASTLQRAGGGKRPRGS